MEEVGEMKTEFLGLIIWSTVSYSKRYNNNVEESTDLEIYFVLKR